MKGLFILRENGCQVEPLAAHCLYKDPDAVPTIYPNYEDAFYFGRGPLMTKGVRSYYNYSIVTNHDQRFKGPQYFIKDPDRIFTPSYENGWEFAFWDFMTPKNGYPSAHEIITGKIPIEATTPPPTFGSTIYVLDQNSECSNNQGFETPEAIKRGEIFNWVLT